LLAGILAAGLLQSETVARACTDFFSQFGDCPDLHLEFPRAGLIMAALMLLSLALSPRGLRKANGFPLHPLVEVSVVFAGLFIAMQPALRLLARGGGGLGVSEPWQFFWMTGVLSAVLDNAPTYLAFATLAAGDRPLSTLADSDGGGAILQAISC